LLIGIDVGGTNTDAVLMDGTNLLAQVKCPTTPDVTSGILSALEDLVRQKPPAGEVAGVMLGTTHFINALLERRDLCVTAALRLCLPATQILPPLVDWPAALRDAIGGLTYMVSGGHEFDGREISPLIDVEVRAAARDMRSKGVESVAVCGVFSPINPEHEEIAARIIGEEAPDLRVTLSHQNARVGLLERENAAVLNGSLLRVAERTIEGIRQALISMGIDAPLYLSQNDGTLMNTDFASRYPVLAIASGPTNSMRGAAFLSGVQDAIVVDIGGSSTDVGALVKGFPREASVAVGIAGVRTNFRMPEVLSIALGGGSMLEGDPPQVAGASVGYRLTEEALVFGGGTLTATDVAVAGGLAQLGDPGLVSHLERSQVDSALAHLRQQVETAVDRVKISAASTPVVLVGGGNLLVGDSLEGASQVIRPEHADVANAIGAAIAQVSGQVEKVFSPERTSREEALTEARNEAVARAVAAGADPATVELLEIDEVPLTYLPSNATLVRVKVAGKLGRV
jgi:N-methylhydantoinase A/oxoprolinase/acetone carboxylase beta subunit